MKQVTTQMGNRISNRFGAAMAHLQHVSAGKRWALVHQAGTVRTVLSGERYGRISKMVELGQGRIDVCLFGPRRGRVGWRPAEQEQDYLGFRVAQLLQETAQPIAKIG